MGIDAETYAAAKAYVDHEIEGGGGTLDYEALRNHPSINGNELVGNKSSKQLGIQNLFTGTTTEWAQLTTDQKAQYTHVCFTDDESDLTFDNVPTDGSNNPVKSDGIYDSEKDIYAVMGEMCAKNLIPYPYYDGSEKTSANIKYTVNADGSISCENISNGRSEFYVAYRMPHSLKAGKYILSGCPAGGSNSTYYLWIGFWDGTSSVNADVTTGKEKVITIEQSSEVLPMTIICVAKNGSNLNGKTFKPMLRLASITDNTYQRYAKTNKQLTDEIANKVDKVEGKGLSTNDYSDTEKGKVADNTSAIEATQDMISDAYDVTATYAVGDYCIYNDTLYKCNTAIATGEAFTPAKWDATTVAGEINNYEDITNDIQINANYIKGGTVRCCKWGKIVIVDFLDVIFTTETIPTTAAFVSNLPPAKLEQFTILKRFDDTTNQTGTQKLRIVTGGTIIDNVYTTNEMRNGNAYFAGQLVYITV